MEQVMKWSFMNMTLELGDTSPTLQILLSVTFAIRELAKPRKEVVLE
jgi:hypothetical protein